MYENLLVIIIHEIPLNSRINKENIRKKQKNPVIIIIPGVIQDKSDLNQCSFSHHASPRLLPELFQELPKRVQKHNKILLESICESTLLQYNNNRNGILSNQRTNQ